MGCNSHSVSNEANEHKKNMNTQLVVASHKQTKRSVIVQMPWEIARGAFQVGILVGDKVANQLSRFPNKTALDSACRKSGYALVG